MLKILKISFLAILGVVTMFFIVSAMMPEKCVVERSIVVNAPVEKVFEEVNDFHYWNEWNTWKDADAKMNVIVSGDAGKSGHKIAWGNNTKTRRGSYVRISSAINSTIENDAYFNNMEVHADDLWKFEPNGMTTKITRTNDIHLPLYMRMMSNKIEETVAPDMERGLNNLKVYCEAAVKP